MKTIYIEQDERNAIAVSSDNHFGVVVQLVSFNDSLAPSSEEPSQLVNHRSVSLISQWPVNIKPKDVNEVTIPFKQRVNSAIAEAKKELASIKNCHKEIDGILNDLDSQKKGQK